LEFENGKMTERLKVVVC